MLGIPKRKYKLITNYSGDISFDTVPDKILELIGYNTNKDFKASTKFHFSSHSMELIIRAGNYTKDQIFITNWNIQGERNKMAYLGYFKDK